MIAPFPAKLAYTATEAVALLPWGKTKVGEMIASGEIPSRFRYGRRYIMHDDLMKVLLSVEPSIPAADEGSAAAHAA
jgi:hypothetical protein